MTTSTRPTVSGNLVAFSSFILSAPRTTVVYVSGCRPTIKAKTAESVKHLVAANIVTFSHEEKELAHGWYE